jgi:hypothetical protein
VPQLLPRYVYSPVVETPIVPAKFGDASGVRGAAMLWPLYFAKRFLISSEVARRVD